MMRTFVETDSHVVGVLTGVGLEDATDERIPCVRSYGTADSTGIHMHYGIEKGVRISRGFRGRIGGT
jgi:hypothetical protein